MTSLGHSEIAEKARLLEQQGQVDHALRLLLDVGALELGVQLLTRHKRYTEAGRLLLKGLGVPLQAIGGLPPDKLQPAVTAAFYLQKGGEWGRAAELFLILGKADLAQELYQKVIAAFGSMQRVGERYRAACFQLIQVAVALEHVSFEMDHILAAYIEQGPYNPGEAEGFYLLGHLYLQKHYLEAAEHVFQRLSARMSSYRDVPRLLSLIHEQKQSTYQSSSRVPSQHGYAPAAPGYVSPPGGHYDLPGLPELPVHPGVPLPSSGHRPPTPQGGQPQVDSRSTPPPSPSRHEPRPTPVPSTRAPQQQGADARGAKALFPTLTAQIQRQGLNTPPSAGSSTQQPTPQAPHTPAPNIQVGDPNLPTHYPKQDPRNPFGPPSSDTLPNPILQSGGEHPEEESLSAHIDDGLGGVTSDDLDAMPHDDQSMAEQPFLFSSYDGLPSASEDNKEQSLDVRFAPGVEIADRYRIIEQIGQGGMAVVFRAVDTKLDEEIALKVFDPFFANDETKLRFKQELKLSRKLSHPNIIRLHDIGSHGQYHYISMELLNGTDLEQMLQEHSPFDIAFGLEVLIQMCEGLQAAHDVGVIHRDVKPSNFFLTVDGYAKVMDFGIATEKSSPKLTATGTVVGTGLYMAPERAVGKEDISPESDLYSLGVVAFEMFTGTLPFIHDDIIPLLMMHVHDPVPSPRQYNPLIPLELEQVIFKLLEKKPENRYTSCRELATVLHHLLQQIPEE